MTNSFAKFVKINFLKTLKTKDFFFQKKKKRKETNIKK